MQLKFLANNATIFTTLRIWHLIYFLEPDPKLYLNIWPSDWLNIGAGIARLVIKEMSKIPLTACQLGQTKIYEGRLKCIKYSKLIDCVIGFL